MKTPKMAVLGSCVSRDPFNRMFYPHHKDHATLVADVFQSSMPSFVRTEAVTKELCRESPERYQELLKREYMGKNMAKILLSRPDLLIIDFYADVHFGSTKLDELYVTRNHMAFSSSAHANEYYDDVDKQFPDRGRFEGLTSFGESSYANLAINCLRFFSERLRAESPKTDIIINSARFAPSYEDDNNMTNGFPGVERLIDKNLKWDAIDDAAEQIFAGGRIRYADEDFVGSSQHPWGLNPVHYKQEYYKKFWRSLDKLIKD